MEDPQSPSEYLAQDGRFFFDSSPLAMLVVDSQSRLVQYINPAFVELFPQKTKPYLGRSPGELLPEGEAQDCLELVDRVLRTGKPETIVHQPQHNPGSGGAFWSCTAWSISGHDGKPVWVMIHVADLTKAMDFGSRVREMNEALLISSVHQHELADNAKIANEELGLIQLGLEEVLAKRAWELEAANRLLEDQVVRLEQAEGEQRRLLSRLSTAQEEERRRIARELHDHMGQLLTGLQLGIKSIEDTFTLQAPAKERLQGLQTLVGAINKEVHQLALELRPRVLDDLGLVAALNSYLEEWSKRSGVRVDFQSSGLETRRIPNEIETCFYRVTQEALTNVVKHAGARRVSVIVRLNRDQAVLVIEDDGAGFNQETGIPEGRLGLLGMRERIGSLGGTLTIESQPGVGTTIIAKILLTGNGNGGKKTTGGPP